MSKLTKRIRSILAGRERAAKLCKGEEQLSVADLNLMLDEQIAMLADDLADRAEFLYFGENPP